MVAEGGGDWLQPGDAPLNPYFGAEMLRCGERVGEFPPVSKSASDSAPQEELPATSDERG
jgi:hypothetical protein